MNFSIASLLSTFGYFVIIGFLFAETGLLVGFFLPGDTLLLFAGYYAATGTLSLPLVLIFAFIAAVLGDITSYQIGARGGRKLFKREDSVFFNLGHLRRAEEFFKKHGPITVMIARPVAFLRTFAPLVAGMGKMEFKKFVTYNLIGNVLWVLTFTFLGFGLGSFLKDRVQIETVNHYVDIVTVLILAGSIGSVIILAIRQRYFKKKVQKV